MKVFPTFLIVAAAIFLVSQLGFADRVYQWIDSDGVTHLSKNPPPESSKFVDVMEYAVPRNPVEPTVTQQSGIAPEKPKEQMKSEPLPKTAVQPKPEIDMSTACYVQARNRDIYVYVSEDRRPGSSYQNTLWKGDIRRGQRKLIKSSRGKIKYSYQGVSETRSYGDNQAKCEYGNLITIE